MNLTTFYSLCLQGDITSAIELLEATSPKTPEEDTLLEKYKKRFYGEEMIGIEISDPWIRDAIHIYHNYFHDVLMKKLHEYKAEEELAKRLSSFLEESFSSAEDAEIALKKEFEVRGYYFLGGVTPPYRGPYIWKTQEKLTYDVVLPNETQTITVYHMKDFLMESWLSYVTLEHKGAGGWANESGVFCNYDRYKDDLESNQYVISFLKHEAQHFNDYLHYPILESKDLEYRAKLVELIYYDNHEVLEKFLIQAKDDPQFPHPKAAYEVIKGLSRKVHQQNYNNHMEEWKAIDYNIISSYALELHQENTMLLNEQKTSF
ncbi:hypothetical protein ACLM5H_17145 [Fredinandcohnia humi]